MATTTVHEHREATVLGRRTWTPAQLVAGAIGLLLVVIGGVAMARAGLDGSWTDPVVEVLGFDQTALFGAIEVGFGLVLILTAFATYEVRSWLTGLGLVALAFGLIVIVEPTAFDGSLGLEEASGWLYAALGVGMIAAAWLSPIFVTGHTRAVREDGGTVVATTPGSATVVAETAPAPAQVANSTHTVYSDEAGHVVVVEKQ